MKKHIFIFAGVVTFAIGIFAFVALRNNQNPSVVTLPPIVSTVKTLEIVRIKLKNAAQDATVEIELRNNSPKTIVSVNIESGDDRDSSGTTQTGFRGNPPKVVVLPNETFNMDFSLSNVIRGLPIRINGVFYADGSEDGEAKVLERMRRMRERNEQKRSSEN